MLATSKIVFAKLVLNEFTCVFVLARLLLKLATSVNTPVTDPLNVLTVLFVFANPLLIFATSITVFATVVLNVFTAALFPATLLLKLATSVNAPVTDPLKLFTVIFVFAKLLLIFATSKFVLDILPANIPNPGTVGAVAVPDKSPANCTVPKLINVAGAVVLDKSLLST